MCVCVGGCEEALFSCLICSVHVGGMFVSACDALAVAGGVVIVMVVREEAEGKKYMLLLLLLMCMSSMRVK